MLMGRGIAGDIKRVRLPDQSRGTNAYTRNYTRAARIRSRNRSVSSFADIHFTYELIRVCEHISDTYTLILHAYTYTHTQGV